jgi:hypothetical protein
MGAKIAGSCGIVRAAADDEWPSPFTPEWLLEEEDEYEFGEGKASRDAAGRIEVPEERNDEVFACG